MAHKKGVGSSDNGRDSKGKRLGIKLFGGQVAIAGNILVRQRGLKYKPGEGVGVGRDHTLYALVDGRVEFKRRHEDKVWISIAPMAELTAAKAEFKAEVKAAAKGKDSGASSQKPKQETTTLGEISALANLKEVNNETIPAEEISAENVADAVIEEAPKKKEKAVKGDDLKKVEGIGPKIEELLHAGGIVTFADLAAASLERIQEILTEAGPRYSIHNPATWSKQAALAAEGKWDELQAWQDEMDGGKE